MVLVLVRVQSQDCKKSRSFDEADKIREDLNAMGVDVQDRERAWSAGRGGEAGRTVGKYGEIRNEFVEFAALPSTSDVRGRLAWFDAEKMCGASPPFPSSGSWFHSTRHGTAGFFNARLHGH